MPFQVKSEKSFNFHRYHDAEPTGETAPLPNPVESALVKAGVVTEVPDWVADEWMFQAGVNEGSILVLGEPPITKKAIAPKGTAFVRPTSPVTSPVATNPDDPNAPSNSEAPPPENQDPKVTTSKKGKPW